METNKFTTRSLVVADELTLSESGTIVRTPLIVRPRNGGRLTFLNELESTRDTDVRAAVERSGCNLPALRTVKYLGKISLEGHDPVYAHVLTPKVTEELERRDYSIQINPLDDILKVTQKSNTRFDKIDIAVINEYHNYYEELQGRTLKAS